MLLELSIHGINSTLQMLASDLSGQQIMLKVKLCTASCTTGTCKTEQNSERGWTRMSGMLCSQLQGARWPAECVADLKGRD